MPYGVPGLFRVFGGPAGSVTDNSAGPPSAGENLFGNENVAIGIDAGADVGVDPTIPVDGGIYIGARAGQNVRADECIIIGRDAAPNINSTVGHAGQIIIGARAFSAIEIADNARRNLIIGFEAADSWNPVGGSSADDNVIIGHRALAGVALTNTIDQNVIIGAEAGENFGSTVCNNNVFIGFRAGRVGTSTNNVLIGSLAGEDLTSGANNVFIGQDAGMNNTTGGSNVFVGGGAGQNVVAGSVSNVLLGEGSGQSLIGDGNVGVGADANVATADNQTVLGRLAGSLLAGKSSAIIIGANAARSGSIPAARPFVLESALTFGTSNPTPFLYGDLGFAALLLSQFTSGGVAANRGLPLTAGVTQAGPIFCLADANAAGGGAGLPATGATAKVGMFYDSVEGEIFAIDPASVIAQMSLFNSATGASSVTFTPSNKPGATTGQTQPDTWFQVLLGASRFWVPAYLD